MYERLAVQGLHGINCLLVKVKQRGRGTTASYCEILIIGDNGTDSNGRIMMRRNKMLQDITCSIVIVPPLADYWRENLRDRLDFFAENP